MPILQEWRINLVERFFNTNKITSDDGFITRGVNDAYSNTSTCTLLDPLESLFSKRSVGNTIFRKNDIVKVNGVNCQDHSPIIGYAYDGNPIYGPMVTLV